MIELNPLKWFGKSAVQVTAPVVVMSLQQSKPAKAVETNMAFSFKSVGHFFAKAYEAIIGELPKIEATAATVETVTAAIPVYGPLALTAEKCAYAVLGELSAVLTAGGAAAQAKLANAGLDINVIKTVQDVVASVPNIVAVAKSL